MSTNTTIVEFFSLVAIAEVNNDTTPNNSSITATSITIKGTASGTKSTTTFRTGSDGLPIEEITTQDVTNEVDTFIQFGNQATLHEVQTTNGGKNWSLILPVPLGSANANGDLLITAIAKIQNQQSTNKVTVKVDNEAPKISIIKPKEDEAITLPPNGTSVQVLLEVEATDNRGVTKLLWSFNSKNFPPTNTFEVTGNTRTATVLIEQAGEKPIFVQAKDAAGNTTIEFVTVDVASEVTPVDPENVTGLISYLGDLLDFAAKRVTGKTPLSNAPAERKFPSPLDFAIAFCQRFDEFLNPQNRSVALQTVHQVRIGIDVLRKYLLSRKTPPPNLQNLEKIYSQQAYDALLSYLGTSQAQLRLALTSDTKKQTALAERLGIGTEALTDLLLSPDRMNETNLEQVFGLANTNSLNDPFATNSTPPLLLSSQRNYLRSQWRQQDDAIVHPTFAIPIPVIDPDLIPETYLRSEAATALWNRRRQEVDDSLARLRTAKPPTTNAIAHFEAVLNLALKGMTRANLVKLFDAEAAGNPIESQLKALFLERSTYLFLKHIDRLLTNQIAVTNEDWEQLYNLLVQVQKLRDAYPRWRAEEVNQALALGPDDFTLLSTADAPSELPFGRATETARRNWEIRLSARIEEDRALVAKLKSVIDSTEVVALPVLRDLLLQQIATAVTTERLTAADAAERLTAELFIDFSSSAEQKTTRVDQAIESLQGILFALRMGNLVVPPVLGTNPAHVWQLHRINNFDESQFDEEWQWMSAYATWQAAMGVFLFPENFLQPTTRPLVAAIPHGQTQQFRDLADKLRGIAHLTRNTARQEANAYLSNLPGKPSEFSFKEPTSIEQIEAHRQKIDSVLNTIDPAPQKFHNIPIPIQEVFFFVPLLLAQHLERSGEYLAALDWYKAVYAFNLPARTPTSPSDPRKIYKGLVLEEDDTNTFPRTDNWLLEDFNPHKIAQTRANVYTRFTIASLARCLLTFADDQFTKETNESIPQARSLYLTTLDLLNLPEMLATSKLVNIPLVNTTLESLRSHANLNLFKLRHGLNIAGLQRPGATKTSGSIVRQPTPYRYAVLIERAKQLAATAGQIEASFLAALEKRDAELYALLQAQQDIQLSQAQIQLQNLRTNEALDGVQLAQRQRDRSRLQVNQFRQLLDEGVSNWEKASFAATATIEAISVVQSIAAGGVLGAITTGLSAVATLTSTKASFERREQEWEQQLSLARQDVLIGNQQIRLAQDQVAIANQELQIAGIQANHALENLTFLSTKFTNAELFDWMSRVLERIYAYFLQQATATARLAEIQLAFERQETLPAFVQSDYWQVPEEGGFGSSGQQKDRRGLTGSSRLLQAITELDQYAFTSDRRKLQLTKTISLEALSPVEFQRFRQTGTMIFATPMELFDRDFPGHYLRLVERVRTSVIALIPPQQGVRATLSSSGVSRVVANSSTTNNSFQNIIVNHGPQAVALSSPNNATGLFELDEQPEMLLPFEKIGVDTLWEFQMPKPANPFDYNTIADVLITIEYTALNSSDYRQQVIQSLKPDLSADRPFSLRTQFADQWYDLHNFDRTDTPLTVKFETVREDFPPNLDDLQIEQIAMYFARSRQATYTEVQVAKFFFTEEGRSDKVGGAATTTDDIISTRRGNGSNWISAIGKSPIGEWELSFADNDQTKEMFAKGQLDDILFVVTYKGRSPAWPV